jgi:hypothetical protein
VGQAPAPLATIGALAAIAPAEAIPGLSLERRRTLKTRAEMILDQDFTGAPAALAVPLGSLLTASTEDLALSTDQDQRNSAQLQRQLRALRELLKNAAFANLRLADLLPGSNS